MLSLPPSRQPFRPADFARVSLLLSTLFLTGAPAAFGGSLGMVSDNSMKQVTIFDADLDRITASLNTAPGQAMGDCSVSSDERLGFSTGSSSEITVIELGGVGVQGQRKQVAISNLGVDMSLSPDDEFLVLAGGGALQQPLSVIDTRSQEEVATAGPFVDHTSVEFCDNGTLLVTTTHGEFFGPHLDNALYDARIDADGNISLKGHRVSSGAQPNNSACAPGSFAAVLLDREGALISFTLPELAVADRENLAASAGIAATFSRDGRRLYVRTTDTVEAFHFDPLTGEMRPDWVHDAPGTLAFYGMDQIALHPEGNKLYVDGAGKMMILNPHDGSVAGTMPMRDSTGICFANAPRIPGSGRVVTMAGSEFRPKAP